MSLEPTVPFTHYLRIMPRAKQTKLDPKTAEKRDRFARVNKRNKPLPMTGRGLYNKEVNKGETP